MVYGNLGSNSLKLRPDLHKNRIGFYDNQSKSLSQANFNSGQKKHLL